MQQQTTVKQQNREKPSVKKRAEEKSVFLDFEFSGITKEFVDLVSCVTYDQQTKQTKKFWLHKNPGAQKNLSNHLLNYQIIIGYACVAEARSFLSLNLDPLYFNWIDLFLEYRMLTNHNDRLQWGKQLVDGKVKYTKKPPPKWERSEEDAKTGFRATHSLAEATYKLTGQIRDTEEKTKTRDLIISAPKKFTEEEKERIIRYNAVDVEFLPTIWKRIKEEFVEFAGGKEHANLQEYFKEAMVRGRYSAHTALMESMGYPINVDATRNFSKQIPSILSECQRDINSQFKLFEVTSRIKGNQNDQKLIPFKWDKKNCRFSWNQTVTREWLKANVNTKNWMKTGKGAISLALEAWERHFQFKHDYPRGNFGAQMVRFLKLKQSLYGFSDSGGKRKNFWDSVGPDGRVRPYMNIYGAQSSRSQPAASGFMFLKPAWMRALVQPAPDRFIAGVDYGQQEFFLSALESEDQNMIAAYLSGDPYMYGAKLAGAIPKDGRKEDYKIERDLFKNTYLGILYGMTKYGLSVKLTGDMGREFTEEEAQDQIDLFEESYPDYMEWKKELLESYEEGNGIKLPCLARGTIIQTEKGVKKIEEITLGDKIWNGEKFSDQAGIVLRGVKDVIADLGAGITATPDHLFLIGNTWRAWAEVAGQRGYQLQTSEKNSGCGKLLLQKPISKVEGMSFVAAYVTLKCQLESNNYNMERLLPVLDALNLGEHNLQEKMDIAKLFLTCILEESGKTATGLQKKDALISAMRRTENTITLRAFDSNLDQLKSSWNTLLRLMGMKNGTQLLIELTTMGIMSLGTYEQSVKKLITGTAEVYDILNCQDGDRFQAGNFIVHNCGWMVGPDNENFRSVLNVPIQGFGASIMRKAVDIAVSRGCKVILTLHDAIYIEDSIGNEEKIGVLMESMKEAFQFYYKGTKLFETASAIKLDPFAWSPSFPQPTMEKNKNGKLEKVYAEIESKGQMISVADMYIDERSVNEFLRFSRYFESPETDLI